MQQAFDFPIQARFTFENFVVCSGNRAAYHFALQVAKGDGCDNLLYIYGPPGSGKTHLLFALGLEMNRGNAHAPLPYLSFRKIDELYQGEYPAEAASKLAKKFRDSPLLLIDDIHLIPDNINVRVELWQLFNDFYTSGRKIVVTGHFPPRDLPHLDEHLISRLLWGLVARVDIGDDESRRMIMKKLAEDRQIRVPEEVFDYLLMHARRDIPSLLQALDWLRRSSFATKRKITARMAREALEGVVM